MLKAFTPFGPPPEFWKSCKGTPFEKYYYKNIFIDIYVSPSMALSQLKISSRIGL